MSGKRRPNKASGHLATRPIRLSAIVVSRGRALEGAGLVLFIGRFGTVDGRAAAGTEFIFRGQFVSAVSTKHNNLLYVTMVYFFENNFNIKNQKEDRKKAPPKGDAFRDLTVPSS